jgi:hypothetical protein
MAPHYRFTVRTAAEPQALPRLLNHFARRSLTPLTVVAKIGNGDLGVTIEHVGLSDEVASLIAEQMRSSVLTSHVDLALL